MQTKGLYRRLAEYSASDYYPFHMPGHKRNAEACGLSEAVSMDITEIDGFDDLHHSRGIIKEAKERAAGLYGAEETHFLVNGSTAGILAAIAGCFRPGDQILIGRNSHKSVYNALYLNDLRGHYLYPSVNNTYGFYESISLKEVEQGLSRHPDIKGVLITSPTYEGVVSDISAISTLLHSRGILLIVDEAHGAHFGFHKSFPCSAVSLGADVVIHSLHKTLPALTQSALIHLNGSLADRERIRRFLSIYQTSSPSYLLMAGIDRCMELLESGAESLFLPYLQYLSDFRKELLGLQVLAVADAGVLEQGGGIYSMDLSKLILYTGNSSLSGQEVSNRLVERYRIQPELSASHYVLAMTSVMDREEGFLRLSLALKELDAGMVKGERKSPGISLVPPKKVMEIRAAIEGEKERIALLASAGRVAGDYLYRYPPGVPLLAPGELIAEDMIGQIKEWLDDGFTVHGYDMIDGSILAMQKGK